MTVAKVFPSWFVFFLSVHFSSLGASAFPEHEYLEIRRTMGRQEYANALECCLRLTRRWPASVPCYETLAEIGYYGKKEQEVSSFLLESIDAGRCPGLASYGLGLLYYLRGDCQGAVVAFEEALMFGEHVSDIYKHFEYAYEKLHGPDAAIRYFNAVSMRAPRDPGYAYAAALAHWSKPDHKTALLKLNDAIALAPEEPRFREAKAAALLSSGDEHHALPLLKECLQAARQRQDLSSIQFIQSYLLNLEIEKGNWEAAKTRALLVVEEAKEFALLRWLGWGLKKLSDVEFQGGSYLLSAAHVSESIRLARLDRDDGLLSQGLYRLFQCRYELGQYRDALRTVFERLEIADQQGSSYLLSYGISDAAMVYDALGMKDIALEFAVEALLRSEAIGQSVPLLIQTRATVGLVHQGRGNSDAAIRQFQSVLSLMPNQNKWKRHRATILCNIGKSYLNLGKKDIALRYLTEGLALSRKSRYSREEGYALSFLGECYLQDGQWGKAYSSFMSSYLVAKQIEHKPVMLLASKGLAESCRLQGSDREALKWYSQARQISASMECRVNSCETSSPVALFDCWRDEVEVLCRIGEYYEAFTLAQVAKEGARRYVPQNTLRTVSPMVRASIDSLNWTITLLRGRLSSLRRTEPTEPVEREFIPLLWKIGKLELQRDDIVNSLTTMSQRLLPIYQANLRSISGIRARLDSVTAMVDFVVGKRSTQVFVVRRDTVYHRSISITDDSLGYIVSSAGQLFANSGRRLAFGPLLADFNPKASHEIFRLLFPKWECEFAGIKRLLLIPDRCLHRLPFECLWVDSVVFTKEHQSVAPHFLVSRVATEYDQSAGGFFAEGESAGATTKTVLALACPNRGDQETLGDFNLKRLGRGPNGTTALVGTEREVAFVKQWFTSESTILVSSSATKRRFLLSAPLYHILHIAAHAVVDSILPMYSRVCLASKDQGRSSYLFPFEISSTKLQARLAVLSCCNTLSATDASLDDGFIRGFKEAGVSEVVASLWVVDDEASAILMNRFYSHLSAGIPPIQALQEAKLDMIGLGYSDPFYWAPYILVGSHVAFAPLVSSVRKYSSDLMSVVILVFVVLTGIAIYVFQQPELTAQISKTLKGKHIPPA